MNIPSLFDPQPTLTRQRRSYDDLQPLKVKSQLHRVISALPGTSREIAERTGIERTSVCRVLSENKNLFDVQDEKLDPITQKYVTYYHLKGE